MTDVHKQAHKTKAPQRPPTPRPPEPGTYGGGTYGAGTYGDPDDRERED